MNSTGAILLTFDVEEFDLPLEYNLSIDKEEQMSVGYAGLQTIEKILSGENICTTLFTTANFALHYPESIRHLSCKNEIDSHYIFHGSFKKEDLLESRNTLEKICDKKIEGIRMPRFKKINMDWVKEAGYIYDSSINPTFIPGRYNNRHLPRNIYTENGIVRVPMSVSPNIRFPLFWLSFKNIPYNIFKKIALRTLKKDGYLSLYFHPWEFTDLSSYPLPFYLKNNSGELLVDRLIHLITDLKKEAEFTTVAAFLKNRGFI